MRNLKTNKSKDQSREKLELNRTIQNPANEAKDLQDRDADPKEKLKEFGKIKGVLKKRALSDMEAKRILKSYRANRSLKD